MQIHSVRDFSRFGDAVPIPDLIKIQTESYARFLQEDREPSKRDARGLEGLLREVFPSDESHKGVDRPGFRTGPPNIEPIARDTSTPLAPRFRYESRSVPGPPAPAGLRCSFCALSLEGPSDADSFRP